MSEPNQRCLLDRPQRLGILPTLWFWNDKTNWRLVRWPIAGLVFVTLVAVQLWAPGPVIGAAIAVSAFYLALGVLEKYVRHQAATRRRQLAAAQSPLALDPPTQPQPDHHP